MKLKKIFRNFPKINMIIGRKQLVVAGLTVVLGTAVISAAVYANGNGKANIPTSGDSENYGEATLVSNPKTDVNKSDTYFAQARLDKLASRDEAKDLLQAIAAGGDITKEETEVLANDASALSGYIESETKIESVLKAQGFTDVLCYLSDKGANIIVKTAGLTAEDAAKIKNALLAEVDVPADKITIVEVN
jgi:stage III sporulation protein AH